MFRELILSVLMPIATATAENPLSFITTGKLSSR